jgi:hypothetical protein
VDQVVRWENRRRLANDAATEEAMGDASDLLPEGWTPEEELMFETAECRECAAKVRSDARVWAHQHVTETGHAVQVHLGYEVRDTHWLDRLPYERLAEIEALRTARTSFET